MPILDPSTQYELFNISDKYRQSDNAIRFYLRYLRLASSNIIRNFSTIQTSLTFKNDLFVNFSVVNDKFGCEMNQDDFKNPTITDYYKYLYDIIVKNELANKKPQKLEGKYFFLQSYGNTTRYFMPNLLQIKRSWFLTDTRTAILAIDKYTDPSNFPIIYLEADLLAASGFTLVLCVNIGRFKKEIFELISRNQFAEIHIDIFSPFYKFESFLENSENDKHSHFYNNKGFVYIYSFHVGKKKSDVYNKIKALKKIPRISVILFAKSINQCIKKPVSEVIDPFAYCKNGFSCKKLRVFLTNTPFYDTDENGKPKPTPSKTTKFAVCYISPKDFLNWKSGLIEVLFRNKKNHCIEKMVKFKDLHKMNADMFVADPLVLYNIKSEDFRQVDAIQQNVEKIVNERKGKNFRRNSTFSFLKQKDLQNKTELATYAYTYFSNSLKEDFSIHRPQVYTIIKAIQELTDKVDYNLKSKQNELKRINDFLSFDMIKFFEKNGLDTKDIDQFSTQPHIQKLIDNIIQRLPNFLIDAPPELIQKVLTFSLDKPTEYLLNLIDPDESKMIKGVAILSKEAFDKRLESRKKLLEIEIAKAKEKSHKGIVYQVETGEGKSCIIAIIAAILAMKGKYVHIASSNIKLSNRDYMNSYFFFDLLKLKSAVFLHENELPISAKKKTEEDDENEEENKNDKKNKKGKRFSFGKKKLLGKNDKKGNKNDKEKQLESKNDQKNKQVTENNKESNQNSKNDQDKNNPEIPKMTKDAKNTFADAKKIKNINENDYINEHDFFKDNMESYYEYHTQDDKTEYAKYYRNEKVEKFYSREQFKNSSQMNFGVCGIDHNNNMLNNKERPKIVFSTFVNLECFYLKMMELCPGEIDEYYENCVLLVDEADSILIDEIANGTIVSREMKSNSRPILKFIYDNRNELSAQDAFDKIRKDYPKCVDLKVEDIERMYSEIDLVNNKEKQDNGFTHGQKYIVRPFTVKNDKKKKRFWSQTLELVKDIVIDAGKEIYKELIAEKKDDDKDEEFEDEDDDDDDDDDEDEEEEEDNDSPVTTFHEIIPFDYSNKGISEPNKEFGGFIQQFIAIKESKKYKNMIIKDMSISYLYVSHPIFVNLYSKVCGFTGTIGSKKDQKIIEDNYDLILMKVPRNEPNHRIDLPMILCDNIPERNKKIAIEVIDFHKRGIPVIVIFQDLKEIDDVLYILNYKGIKGVNIFDGQKDTIRPDKIAGQKGAISLGTNVCGRGTNIIAKGKPLHVIIAYYTINKRVMNQARGRTARQGRQGTCRIICLKKQYLNPTTVGESSTDAALEEFAVKNQMQSEFIQYYMNTKHWIFENEIDKQNLNKKEIKEMRKARINVNRIVAYKYEFPLKMSVETFLKIQSQKIFSLFNCPNCKYSWRLFQRYIREMILESWSLKVTQFDEEFFDRKENEEYKNERKNLEEKRPFITIDEYQQKINEMNKKYSNNIKKYRKELIEKKTDLIIQLKEYLPDELHHIVPIFMHIFKKIVKTYESDVINSFNSKSNVYYQHNKFEYVSCQVGFKPYSLLSLSGARINKHNLKKTNYIKDPELSYLKKLPNKHRLCWLSITEKIDDLFNSIFQMINNAIGKKTFLKFFMRRTLCGCEFGICLDIKLENTEVIDPNCLIDKDPLLVFTISVRSMAPLLAGILIILLVYASVMAKDIFEWVVMFPENFTKKVIKKGIGIFLNTISKNVVIFALNKATKFLRKKLKKQIKDLKEKNYDKANTAASIIECIMYIFDSKIGSIAKDKFTSFLGNTIKISAAWENILNKDTILPFINLSFHALLCLATFIMNFCMHKESIKKAKKDAKIYDDTFSKKIIEEKDGKKVEKKIDVRNEEEVLKAIDELKDTNEKEFVQEKIENVPDLNNENIEKEFLKYRNSYLYQFKACNPFDAFKKITDYTSKRLERKEEISTGVAMLKAAMKKGNPKKKMLKLCYLGMKKLFGQQMRLYATNKFPSILNVVGYHIGRQRQDLYLDESIKGTLEMYLSNATKKLKKDYRMIIAYGVACAFELLHSHNIVHRNLKPATIFINADFHPFVSEFFYARQTESKYKYALKESTAEFMAPEFIENYALNQESFKIDVYAFGVTLYRIVTGRNPFAGRSEDEIKQDTLDGKRPSFGKTSQNWIDLISRCWDQDPNKRPSFMEICDLLETDAFVNDQIDVKLFMKYKNNFKRVKTEPKITKVKVNAAKPK